MAKLITSGPIYYSPSSYNRICLYSELRKEFSLEDARLLFKMTTGSDSSRYTHFVTSGGGLTSFLTQDLEEVIIDMGRVSLWPHRIDI